MFSGRRGRLDRKVKLLALPEKTVNVVGDGAFSPSRKYRPHSTPLHDRANYPPPTSAAPTLVRHPPHSRWFGTHRTVGGMGGSTPQHDSGRPGEVAKPPSRVGQRSSG